MVIMDDFEKDPIEIMPHYHVKIEEGCKQIAEILKDIWPMVQEHCGNHLEIDMGSIKARIGPKNIVEAAEPDLEPKDDGETV